MNPTQSNPNDLKIVTFHNKTDFGFTPEMGCMFNGQPINGITGAPGVNAGESLTVPYHVGKQLAINLAKRAILNTAPRVDAAGVPQGVPLWDESRLKSLADSYITEMYSEQAPQNLSEADKMMAKIEELKKFVTDNVPVKEESVTKEATVTTIGSFQDKAEVIAELVKRGIKFDARSNKDTLEKLIV